MGPLHRLRRWVAPSSVGADDEPLVGHWFTVGIGLPVIVPAPAGDGLIGPYGARMKGGCCDGGVLACGRVGCGAGDEHNRQGHQKWAYSHNERRITELPFEACSGPQRV